MSGLRPLTPDGSRPKRDSEINNSERARLDKISKNGRNMRPTRDNPGRREK